MKPFRTLAGPIFLLALVPGPTTAARAQEAGNAPASLSELEAAVERDPGNPDLHVALGLAYWGREDSPRALEAFQRAVEADPRSAEAHNWVGVALAAKTELHDAIAAFRRAIALDPEYGRAYSNLGSALAVSGDYAEAVVVFEKALGLEPNSLGAHFNLGMALREKGDLKPALLHLGHVIDGDPTNALVRYELGQTLRQIGDLDGAVASLEKAIEIDPEMREGYYALGVALRQQSAAALKTGPSAPETSPADAPYRSAQEAIERGELAVAQEQLNEALRLDEAHADAHSALGYVLGQQGEFSAALAHLERAVALAPDSAPGHYNLGVALWYSGSKDRARAELRRCVELDPAAGGSYALLGTARRERGDLEGARAALQRAIALLPPTAAVYVDLGITYLGAGELDKALGQFEAGLNLPSPARPTPDWDSATTALRQALVESPGRADAHNVQGRMLGRQGIDAAKVLAEFREAVRLRPDFAEAQNNLGLVLIQTGDDEAGIAALREAIRLAPDFADAHSNLGAVLTTSDPEEAIRELEKAVELAPTSAKLLFNLSAAYGASPDHGRAMEIEQLRKVIELAPNFARAHLALGKALLRDGSVDEAIEELQEATRLEPERGDAHYQLGLALARAGRRDEAAPLLKQGRRLVADDENTQKANLDLAEGRAALEDGDLERAAAKLRSAVRRRPDSSEAQRSLGEVLEKQGDATGAIAAYRAALELNPVDPSAREGMERLGALDDDPERLAELEGYILEGRFEEVEPLLAEYVEQHPKSSRGWYSLGYSLGAQQKIGDAIQALARSLELDLGNAEAHKMLGRMLMIIGRFDMAQAEFEEAIRYKPDSAEIHYNLGKLLSMQDVWGPARDALQEAVRLDPTYVRAVDALGFALEALGDDAGAVVHYEKAAALNEAQQGRLASPHVNLSAYHNRTGNPEKALEHARKALELNPESDRAWFQKSRADDSRGDLVEAVASLNQAISLNPRAASYYYVLARLYRRLGKAKESREALATFKRLERETEELQKKRREKTRGNPVAAGSEG
jgi:tetratricopeptide (TPR) repeat protein